MSTGAEAAVGGRASTPWLRALGTPEQGSCLPPRGEKVPPHPSASHARDRGQFLQSPLALASPSGLANRCGNFKQAESLV